MGFNKHKNMLKGISNVVEATSKEEQIHGDFGIDLIKVLQKENPDWFTDEYHKRIQEMCLNAFEAEKDVVDWIFENGELDFLPKAVVNEFLKNRFNNSLESIGIEKVFKFDTSSISGGMFSIKYQLFLNDLYYFNSVELLQYAMTKSYLEDIDFLLTTDKQIRFNKRQDRMYLDIDWNAQNAGDFLVIDCYRALDPASFTQVYNDSFVKKYLTSLIKRQWGQNLIKFRGVKLPGGIELNGREIYEDAEREIEQLKQTMMLEHELPPLDLIG